MPIYVHFLTSKLTLRLSDNVNQDYLLDNLKSYIKILNTSIKRNKDYIRQIVILRHNLRSCFHLNSLTLSDAFEIMMDDLPEISKEHELVFKVARNWENRYELSVGIQDGDYYDVPNRLICVINHEPTYSFESK